MLEILQNGDKKLLIKSKKLDIISKEDRELAKSMFETMKTNNGIGLAAPQVGEHKRIIVISIGGKNYTMFNPEIYSKENVLIPSDERCLSFPQDEVYRVHRNRMIRVKWLNSKGQLKTGTFEGLEAACIQHEIDHLDGITLANIEEK